ncbi:transposase family protein [Streptomyces asiaticus]
MPTGASCACLRACPRPVHSAPAVPDRPVGRASGGGRPFYSGKHTKHGMNVQVIADPHGELLWASPALPGAVHDIKASRTHDVIDALTKAGLACWADKGYQGAGGTVWVPFRGRWDRLSAGQRRARPHPGRRRASHGDLEELVPAAELRCSTTRITGHVKAVLTLHLTCSK